MCLLFLLFSLSQESGLRKCREGLRESIWLEQSSKWRKEGERARGMCPGHLAGQGRVRNPWGCINHKPAFRGAPPPSRTPECLVMGQVVETWASSLQSVCEAHPRGCHVLSCASIKVLHPQDLHHPSNSQWSPEDVFRTKEPSEMLSRLQSLAYICHTLAL